MANELVLYREDMAMILYSDQSPMASVHPQLAFDITAKKERHDSPEGKVSYGAFTHPTRVTDLFISRYGIMGYGELSMCIDPILGGILEIPRRLTLVLELAGGKEFYDKFKKYFFGASWKLENWIEDISIPQLAGAPIKDTTYYWGVNPDYRSIGLVLRDDIVEVTNAVTGILKEMDEQIDTIRPAQPDPEEQYRQLALKGLCV